MPPKLVGVICWPNVPPPPQYGLCHEKHSCKHKGSHEGKSFQVLHKLFFKLKYLSVSCIACFKCVSVAGDNPACEDKFHNNATEGQVDLVSPCMGGRKGRDGLFPASDCIKVTGIYGELSTVKSKKISEIEL